MRLLIAAILSLSLFSCSEFFERPKGFDVWYGQRFEKQSFYRDHPSEIPAIDSFVISSESFTIDTIYRSMKGPFQDLKFTIPAKDSLLWLTGYRVETLEANSDSLLSDEFMCHNNLNFSDQLLMPWRHELNYFNLRIFTLTQGNTSVDFPAGFGIPVFGAQGFLLNAQVLNHNNLPIDLKVKQRVVIYYIPEHKLKRRMVPLEQRTIFAFKQYGGPAGLYGEAPTVDKYIIRQQYEVTQPKCGVGELANGSRGKTFDLFHDPYGRLFTGHWKVQPGGEEFTIDISSLLQLEEGSRIHYINSHVHPFCEELSLIDKTANKELYKASVYNKQSGIGIDSIDVYKSDRGMPIYPDHRYAIRSVYRNNSNDTLSAMSVMYLYLKL